MYSLFENSVKACDEEFVRFADELGVEKKISEIFGALDKYISGDSKDIVEVLGRFKENVEKTVSSTKKSTRQKKSVLKEISENSLENAQPVENFLVKIEKVSLLPPSAVFDNNNIPVEAKQEPAEMQAPTKLPPRKRKIKAEPAELPKRSTRTRKKNFKYDDSISEGYIRKDSDVIIQNTTISTIDLSEENEVQTNKQELLRMTRSKMRKKAQPNLTTTTISANEKGENGIDEIQSTRTTLKNKRHISISEEPVIDLQTKKKSKANSASDIEANKSAQTEYEDAVSTLENNEVLNRADAIYNKIEVNADATYVLPSTKTNITKKVGKQKEITSPLETTPVARIKTTKQIFSPYEKGSMKEKIEAFEKLGESASRIPKPTRGSNIKTPMKYADADYNSQVPKTFTPCPSKFLPVACSTSNVSRLNSGRHDDSSNGNKSGLSVLKASQTEFREREKRRREKEKEALKKKEALLHALSEEKRKKREEKQLKAQQHREQLEKEKLKQLEIQKKKDEKHKQALADREEKLQKKKEQSEMKRQFAKKKASEFLKEKEEREETDFKNMAEMTKVTAQHKIQKIKLQQQQKHQLQQQVYDLPLYMNTKAPLLPTVDCYDSDQSECNTVKTRTPEWARDKNLKKRLNVLQIIGESLKNTLFSVQTHTPNLQEIFEYIDPKKLKRTSSAIWKKPPRYTLFSVTRDIVFSDDED